MFFDLCEVNVVNGNMTIQSTDCPRNPTGLGCMLLLVMLNEHTCSDIL